jgi:hypothetical protein
MWINHWSLVLGVSLFFSFLFSFPYFSLLGGDVHVPKNAVTNIPEWVLNVEQARNPHGYKWDKDFGKWTPEGMLVKK